jgi:carbon starvation protein CstA
MLLVIVAIALLALAAMVVWLAADRWWHYPIIAVAWVLFFPLIARWLTGDVSQYFPAQTFSEGARGKDEIIYASIYATIIIAVALAAAVFWAIRLVWRGARKGD